MSCRVRCPRRSRCSSCAQARDRQRKKACRKFKARIAWARRLLGGQCAVPDCGRRRGLEFDHIDPSEKEANIPRIWSRSRDVFEREVRKCQLLCAEHHLQKTHGWLDESFDVKELEAA